ncbi:MAG TPA: P1 family peptidase [Acidimicrobiales bacterium]|nr:P1 family peptidase [Acidimicrobiales bacterium]
MIVDSTPAPRGPRLRDLGITVGGLPPGPQNAITDVVGVQVGMTTLVAGGGPRVVGQGPVRTGVTLVLPAPWPVWKTPVFAGSHVLNGNGEATGLAWVKESGLLTSPIGITNTHSVGVVRDALIGFEAETHDSAVWFSLPVVAETYDGRLNDINGMHVTADHVRHALTTATGGRVPEGNVGGGTGMTAHQFKGGTGTSSRVVLPDVGPFTVGVLVQANYGRRERFAVNGVPVGRLIGDRVPLPGPAPAAPPGAGSIIIVVATDAPLLPHQCDRLAQRAGLAVGRLGGVGEHSSGDIFIAFSTATHLPPENKGVGGASVVDLQMLANSQITLLFDAVVEATEEAILNAMVAAETMVGCDGFTVHRLPHDLLAAALNGAG